MSSAVLKATQPTTGNGSVLHRRAVRYPDGDGKPVAETVEHRDAIFYAIHAAQKALEGISDLWISGNDFVYYEKGQPSKRVSPDCYIVLNVSPVSRRSYKTWEEDGKVPNVIWEFTSPKTAKEDREQKFELYEQTLKVPEYFLFDPLNQYLRPRLQGYRLVNGAYQPIPFDSEGRLESVETGIKMFVDGNLLRFIHPRTGEVIRTYEEVDTEVARQTELREAEAARANAAEAEIARLRAELERLQQTRNDG